MMNTLKAVEKNDINMKAFLEEIGPTIARNGKIADETDQFAKENYSLFKQHGIFSALVPSEFGGGSQQTMCRKSG